MVWESKIVNNKKWKQKYITFKKLMRPLPYKDQCMLKMKRSKKVTWKHENLMQQYKFYLKSYLVGWPVEDVFILCIDIESYDLAMYKKSMLPPEN